jgi:enamine deaminase RidA (YjgF/YER057c/UK114 family)
MKREIVNPSTVYSSGRLGFAQAVALRASRVLHVSGQVAWDRERRIVGPGDVNAQARQALANITAILADARAAAADVTRLRIYVVGYKPEMFPGIAAEVAAFYGDAAPGANTLLGVQCLARPEFLIEIEVDAALDDERADPPEIAGEELNASNDG